jgi:hypothetical protein
VYRPPESEESHGEEPPPSLSSSLKRKTTVDGSLFLLSAYNFISCFNHLADLDDSGDEPVVAAGSRNRRTRPVINGLSVVYLMLTHLHYVTEDSDTD